MHATPEWRERELGATLCAECHTIRSERFPEPVDIDLSPWTGSATLELVWWTCVNVFHRRLFDQLESHLEQCAVGRCFDEHGTLIPEYVTCYSPKRLLLRGAPYRAHGLCGTCGTKWLKNKNRRELHVLTSDLDDRTIFLDRQCFFYIRKSVVDAVDWEAMRDVKLLEIPILERSPHSP
ncbi:MAG: hypothetical protein IH989_08850 [Planctomycetes bacterium]|nr:hypothetical protein [Planctomycetota bacterium]